MNELVYILANQLMAILCLKISFPSITDSKGKLKRNFQSMDVFRLFVIHDSSPVQDIVFRFKDHLGIVCTINIASVFTKHTRISL